MEDKTITINDIASVLSVIDVAAERGTFKGNELLGVGQLREKLAAVVKEASEAQKANEAKQVLTEEKPE